VPVRDISIMGRSTQGVIVFSTGEGERVVSVEHIPDENGGEVNDSEEDGPEVAE
jgi:DNA gyrase subunit A